MAGITFQLDTRRLGERDTPYAIQLLRDVPICPYHLNLPEGA